MIFISYAFLAITILSFACNASSIQAEVGKKNDIPEKKETEECLTQLYVAHLRTTALSWL